MTKTITLSGREVSVALDGAHAHIRNDSADIIYAAKTAGITAGADGVASIPAGQAATVRSISGKVYLLGTGPVHIQSDDFVASPFKTSAQAGGSGADEVARAAINAHAGNTEVHVTAAEKAELYRVGAAIIGGALGGGQWTALQAQKGDILLRVQLDTDYDRIMLFKSLDGGETWAEITLGLATSVGNVYTADKLTDLEARIAALEAKVAGF